MGRSYGARVMEGDWALMEAVQEMGEYVMRYVVNTAMKYILGSMCNLCVTATDFVYHRTLRVSICHR